MSSCTGLLISKRRSAKAVREQLLLRYPADVFPYANTISRSVDIDHTIAYVNLDDGGSPGQTRIGNLGPHIRYHHRIKTFGGWQVCQPEPGIWLWRSPHHRIYLVNPSGTPPTRQHRIRPDNLARRRRSSRSHHEWAIVITRSARGKLCAIKSALSWSVVRAQLSAWS